MKHQNMQKIVVLVKLKIKMTIVTSYAPACGVERQYFIYDNIYVLFYVTTLKQKNNKWEIIFSELGFQLKIYIIFFGTDVRFL